MRPRGFLCREAANECDIPEYCTGESGACPIDAYKKNGNICGQVKSAMGDVVGKKIEKCCGRLTTNGSCVFMFEK